MLLAGLLIEALIAVWWRNHDILRDLYDASSIIVGVGKIDAGMRPYVDFRSTMQSASYFLNERAEHVFGSSYLGLVKGGLVLTLAGTFALIAIWRRSYGGTGAVLLAAAVALGGLAQHVFIFYNPIGILCFAIVAGGLAREPRLWPLQSPEAVLVCGALILGGTNKINFQAFTLAFAALLVVRPWLTGWQSLKGMLLSVAVLLVCGIFVPLALELAWTGATLDEWIQNVLVLPSERVGFVLDIFKQDIYLRPAYDVHHSVIFKPLTATGILLVVVTSVAAWRSARDASHTRAARIKEGALLISATGGVVIGGVLLTLTNVEIITLTSLAFPVGAAAIWTAFGPSGRARTARWGRVLIPLGVSLWTVVGGYAAWNGARVMFGDEPPRRDDYIRLQSLAPSVAYLRGVRLEPAWHDSVLATVKELERLQTSRDDLSAVMFGPAMEWLERAHPESIIPGMPIWYHHGTSLSSGDGPWLEAQLAKKGVDRLVLNPHWESWPGSFQVHLSTEFRQVDLGRFVRVYEKKTPRGQPTHQVELRSVTPILFRNHTGSNVHLGATHASDGAALTDSPWGDILGQVGNTVWEWSEGAYLVQGNFVVMLHPQAAQTVAVVCRVEGLAPEGASTLIDQTLTLTPERPEIRLPFQISPGGHPIRLSIVAEAGKETHVVGGWRDVRIGHAGQSSAQPPPLTIPGLARVPPLVAAVSPAVLAAVPNDSASIDGWHAAPFEIWHRLAEGVGHAGVSIELERRPDRSGHPTLLTLAWYKAGRIEFIQQEISNPDLAETVKLSGNVPESGGWLGIMAVAADPVQAPNVRVRTVEWTF